MGPDVDNNTLQYINTRIANTWMGPESKSFYLKWLSYVDASSALVALLLAIYFLYLSFKFVSKVTKATRPCLKHPADIDIIRSQG